MKFRGLVILLLVALTLSSTVFAVAQKGPFVDKVYFDVRMQQDIGIQDTAVGNTDVFYYGVEGPSIQGLDRATLNKLEIYSIPSGSWSLLVNPIPNAAPYTVKVEGKEYFNVMAIREVRFALNHLINRQYVVDEILGGAGGPMSTMATPGQPGTYRYNLIGSKLGITSEGDENEALKEIKEALVAASKLPELKGKLKEGKDWWTFNGQPVTVKFIIRVDDPQGRVKEGEYVAQQIEKAKIKVDRLMWDRAKANQAVYGGNPADFEYQLYTEGWGAGATRAWWEHIVCQMYAPWYGYMPGGSEPSNWNYSNEEIDRLTKKAYAGKCLTEEEYWETALDALELGIKDAVRIYVCYQNQYFVANKAAFNSRMAYGLGDGLNGWSLYTADTKNKELRATQFSAQGSLFMSAWDPVGTDGFNDVYSNYIAEALYDESSFESPVSAIATPNRAIPQMDTLKVKVHLDEKGDLVGDVPIDQKALYYDSAKKQWVKVGKEESSMVSCNYKLVLSNYHHGVPMEIADFMYADAFLQEWVTQDGENDPYYDEEYSSNMEEDAKINRANIYDAKKNEITCFFDYYFPASEERMVGSFPPGIKVSASGHRVAVCWEIVEALARMVASKTSASGTVYSFSQNKQGTTQVDVLRPSCVADLKAELQKMIAEKHVPVSLKGYITPANAVKRYQAAVKFIDTYKHGYISNGAFYLAKFDTSANFAELRAFRDPTYPYTSDYWIKQFRTIVMSIDKMDIPIMNEKGKDIKITLNVTETIYPNDDKIAADNGEVYLILITDQGEKRFNAKKVKAGVFEAVIPGSATKNLEAGSYTLLGNATIEGAIPSVKPESLIIF
mgnify:FL=1|jgi:peptide/nickel transport system substrate-binding protein